MRCKKSWALILGVVVLYVFTISSLLQQSIWFFVLFAVYAGFAILGTWVIYRDEIDQVQQKYHDFRRRHPMRLLGSEVVDFQHVFSHATDILGELSESVQGALTSRQLGTELRTVTFRDRDKELREPDGREFQVARGLPNRRGATVSVAIHTFRYGEMQIIHWWILMCGFVDWNRLFAFTALAPIVLPFWIMPYYRKEFDLLNMLRRVHSGFYNDLDLITSIRCLHETVYDSVVDVLEKHEIDTSELRVQRAQILNINIQGGRVKVGNITQTMMERVSRKTRRQSA